ncbi:MAG TPA: hypothetical protein VKE25_12360, partial [Actinomycetes bacterium]|nr:hypothetical protein [Actinomycetes bacterium]
MTMTPARPTMPTLTERLWPRLEHEPDRRRSSRAAFGAALVAAIVVPLTRPGLGWIIGVLALIAVFAIASGGSGTTLAPASATGAATGEASAAGAATSEALAAGAATSRTAASARATDPAARALAAVAAVALVGVGTWRAAPWLFAICLIVALLLGSYAVVGGRTWRDLGVVPFVLLWSALLAVEERPRDNRPP